MDIKSTPSSRFPSTSAISWKDEYVRSGVTPQGARLQIGFPVSWKTSGTQFAGKIKVCRPSVYPADKSSVPSTDQSISQASFFTPLFRIDNDFRRLFSPHHADPFSISVRQISCEIISSSFSAGCFISSSAGGKLFLYSESHRPSFFLIDIARPDRGSLCAIFCPKTRILPPHFMISTACSSTAPAPPHPPPDHSTPPVFRHPVTYGHFSGVQHMICSALLSPLSVGFDPSHRLQHS